MTHVISDLSKYVILFFMAIYTLECFLILLRSEDNEKGVLDHISLKIEQGEKLALVGPSGGGKTTICHLLPLFYKLDENSGAIFIDGKNINSLTMDCVRRNIGIVQQDVFLFSGTIKDNIRYGALDATDEERDAFRREMFGDSL